MPLWVTEEQTRNLRIGFRVLQSLYRGKSEYQDILVIETGEYGRMLFLDGTVQTSEGDEFAYHEMLVHVPLMSHPNPKRVLVVGGGDGGTLREVLKHPGVEEAVQVEIDAQVMEVSRRFLPSLAAGLDHPRSRVVVGDGIAYVAEHKDTFDVILVDSTDPVGPAVGLFSPEFYHSCHEALREGGILCVQSESPYVNRPVIRRVVSGMRPSFDQVSLYLSFVPNYPSGMWSFTAASKGPDVRQPLPGRAAPAPARYYTPEVHRAAFALPPFVQELLEEEV